MLENITEIRGIHVRAHQSKSVGRSRCACELTILCSEDGIDIKLPTSSNFDHCSNNRSAHMLQKSISAQSKRKKFYIFKMRMWFYLEVGSTESSNCIFL